MLEVKFTYQRNKTDVMKHTVWHRMVKNKLIMALNILFPLFGLAAIVGSIGLEINPIQYIAMAYLILYPFITYGFIVLRINTLFRNPELVFDQTTYTFSVAGINTASDKGAFLLEWEHVFQIFETKGYFYIYFDRQNSLSVNKEAIGEDFVNQIREMFREFAPKESIKFK